MQVLLIDDERAIRRALREILEFEGCVVDEAENGAQALDLSDPLAALNQAAASLGLPVAVRSLPEALALWTQAWPYRSAAKG